MIGAKRFQVFLLLAFAAILVFFWAPSRQSSPEQAQLWQSTDDTGSSLKVSKVEADIPPHVIATSPTRSLVLSASITNGAAPATTWAEVKDENFDNNKWFYQDDLKDYPAPKYNVHKLKQYKPHHHKGPGYPTFGMYYATRNASLNDPYFLAAQQVIYRLLWDPRSRTLKHPVTVFVAPFIPDGHRDWLRAAGVEIRELGLIEWHPNAPTEGRWKDLFSKINLWNETYYSRIMFMDLDAFPLENVDELLEIAEPEQQCVRELLSEEEQQSLTDELCDYRFTGPHGEDREINVGVIVFKPSRAMHQRLLQQFANVDSFDNKYAEQAFLTMHFRADGAFPVRWVDREWNALFTKPEDEGHIRILHEKIWAYWFKQEHFAAHYIMDTWQDMLKLYDSKEFEEMRVADGLRLS